MLSSSVKFISFSRKKDINGIGLGFSEGNSGSAFGSKLSERVINTAYDIVKAGVDGPEFFQLLPLFQDDIGPDRLSDMIATIILPDIQRYTRRVFGGLGINSENYPDEVFCDGYMMNLEKKCAVLLVPIEILHKLPVAKFWEDIDHVVSENNTIRALMNQKVAEEWTKWASSYRKNYLREEMFKKPDVWKQMLEDFCKVELKKYNPEEQIDYYLERIWKRIQEMDISWESSAKKEAINSTKAAWEILEIFKEWIENHKGCMLYRRQVARIEKK